MECPFDVERRLYLSVVHKRIFTDEKNDIDEVRILMRLLIFSVMVLFANVTAQTPDWVTNQGKSAKYPAAFYLTGYGISAVKNDAQKEEAKDIAVGNARKNIVEKIRVNIQSTVQSKSEETGDKYSSFFSSATQSTSNLEIQGLESETFYDDNNEVMQAFVFVRRDNLVSSYEAKVNALRKEAEEKIGVAKMMEQQNKTTQALNEYLSCYPVMRKLEEAQSVLSCVKISNSLNELEQSAAKNEITVGQIREAVTKLVQRPLKSVDDLAWFLVYQLNEQADKKVSGKQPVVVSPLLYQDTKMGSSFSRYFNQVIEQKLTEISDWNPVRQGGSSLIFSGSYWEQKNNVKFIVNVRNVDDGRIIASAEATVSAEMLAASDRDLTPENYKSALMDQKIFAAGESAGGGLTVEAWTNKETQGNLFTEGEKMKVTVRVNMPCFIRFVYHMADGKRVLLYNEYFMDASKVNVAYEIPQEYECSAPFGSEVLQIFARTDTFEQIQTEKIDGYDYLKEDLKVFVAKTRGMKAAKRNTLQTEERINITTMKN
jgi:hypothetical protein